MSMVNQLKYKNKFSFLLFLIFLGFSVISVLGYVNINSMKKNLDSLYFGSFIPVNELNDISLEYQAQIKNTIILTINHEISPEEGVLRLDNSLEYIRSGFKNYSKHFKRDEELSYLTFATKKMYKINHYFEQLEKFFINENSDFRNIHFLEILNKIDEIDAVIDKLLIYEKSMAQYERKMLLITYDNTLFQLSLIIAIIIGLVLFLAYYMFESIAKHQKYLENTTKKLRESNIQLEHSSYTDTLTSLYNRRYFNMIFDRELKRAKRNQNSFTFMMIDIDFFKQYNDFYGHLEGDKALKKVALALKETLLRPCDYIFRLGGEEFGIILCETDVQNSGFLAQKIIDNIGMLHLKHEKSSVASYLSISIGLISCIPSIGLREDEIIKKADDNLYIAKEEGRNRFISSSEV